MTFKYCLNASTIRTTPILDQIAAAATAGYEAIELWHDKIDEHVRGGGLLRDIRKALDDSGLVVPTTIYLGNWFDASPADYPSVLQECQRRMAQAAELGAHHVIAGPAAGDADYGLGARRYGELLDMGLALGVKPAMEFLGFVEKINTVEDALEIMQRSAHPQATIVIDPFHIFRGGGSFESLRKLTAEQIAISHFNDAPQTPPREEQHDRDRVMPGAGHLDLARYLAILREVGYTGYLSLELFREDLWERNPVEVARSGLANMCAVVDA